MTGWPLLTPKQASELSEAWWPLLAKAVAVDRLTSLSLPEAARRICSGQLEVVFDGESFLAFEITQSVCTAAYAAGERKTLEKWAKHLERYARMKGATRILILGRPGWSRILGYTLLTSICGKDLWAA